jgi:hypothetical protein
MTFKNRRDPLSNTKSFSDNAKEKAFSVNAFSDNDKADILIDFPKIELSYETAVHNKVRSDYMVAIPMGKKFFAWFTVYKDQNVCLLLEVRTQFGACKQILSVTPVITSFDTSLCLGAVGTIVYGTCFHYKQTQFFCLEDCFYYKGTNICAKQRDNLDNKQRDNKQRTKQSDNLDNKQSDNRLTTLKQICEKDLGPSAFNSQCVIFGLPLIHNDYQTLVKTINELPYKIYSVQCHCFDNTDINTFRYSDFLNFGNVDKTAKVFANLNANPNTQNHTNHVKPSTQNNVNNRQQNNVNMNSNNKTQIFKVVADIQADIYYLHSINNGQNGQSDGLVAYIPNYTASVMMNKLFRNIKENANLDALEESDDEEEFENGLIDKFVFLDKSYNMSCNYSHKFKKWIPQKVVAL